MIWRERSIAVTAARAAMELPSPERFDTGMRHYAGENLHAASTPEFMSLSASASLLSSRTTSR